MQPGNQAWELAVKTKLRIEVPDGNVEVGVANQNEHRWGPQGRKAIIQLTLRRSVRAILRSIFANGPLALSDMVVLQFRSQG